MDKGIEAHGEAKEDGTELNETIALSEGRRASASAQEAELSSPNEGMSADASVVATTAHCEDDDGACYCTIGHHV